MLSAGIQIPGTGTILGQNNKNIHQSMIKNLMKGTMRNAINLWKEKTKSRRKTKSNANKKTDQDREIENMIRKAKIKKVIAKKTNNQENSPVRKKIENVHILLSSHLKSKVLVLNLQLVVIKEESKKNSKKTYKK